MGSARPKAVDPARARAAVEIGPAQPSRHPSRNHSRHPSRHPVRPPSRPPSRPLLRPRAKPTLAQRGWLIRGLIQPGGKLPLFDRFGQRVNSRTVRCCIERSWAKPWFSNPLKPDWLVCRLTEKGRRALEAH